MFEGRGCYFQVGDSLRLGMPISTAFARALDTWASWVETMINRNRTSVFFRTFESSHWRCVVWFVIVSLPFYARSFVFVSVFDLFGWQPTR